MGTHIDLTDLSGWKATATSSPTVTGTYVTVRLTDGNGNSLSFTDLAHNVVGLFNQGSRLAGDVARGEWSHPDADPDMVSGSVTSEGT